MAYASFATLKALNNQAYRKVVNNFRRDVGILRFLPWEPETVNGLIHREVVSGAGVTADFVDANGGDSQSVTTDTRKAAIAELACVSAAAGITDAERANAANQPGNWQDNILGQEIANGIAASLAKTASAFYTADGTSNAFEGMEVLLNNGALVNAHGLGSSDLSTWNCKITLVGGASTELTEGAILDHLADLQDGYKGPYPNLCVYPPTASRAVRKALGTKIQQVLSDEAAKLLLTFPVSISPTGMKAFMWEGILFVEDVNAQHGDVSSHNAKAALIFMNTNYLKMVYCPNPRPGEGMLEVDQASEMMDSVVQDLGPDLAQVKFVIVPRGRTNATQDAFDVQLFCTPFTSRRAALSVVADFDLTPA